METNFVPLRWRFEGSDKLQGICLGQYGWNVVYAGDNEPHVSEPLEHFVLVRKSSENVCLLLKVNSSKTMQKIMEWALRKTKINQKEDVDKEKSRFGVESEGAV